MTMATSKKSNCTQGGGWINWCLDVIGVVLRWYMRTNGYVYCLQQRFVVMTNSGRNPQYPTALRAA